MLRLVMTQDAHHRQKDPIRHEISPTALLFVARLRLVADHGQLCKRLP